jgi:hypothetical protein
MERNLSGAFGASGTSDPHAIISSCSLHITGLLAKSLHTHTHTHKHNTPPRRARPPPRMHDSSATRQKAGFAH